MGFADQFGAPIPKPEGSSGSRDVKGTKQFDIKTVSEYGPFSDLGVGSIWGEGMEDRPFQAGLFQKVIGVKWGGVLGFLAVGSTGVFTSEDTEEWNKVANGFSANSVAYGRKRWVAATDSGMMMSKDFGKTWEPVGGPSECDRIVFAGPIKEDGKPEDNKDEGAFYALDTSAKSPGEGQIWSSTDGEHWGVAHVFPSLDFHGNEPGDAGDAPDFLYARGNEAVCTTTHWSIIPASGGPPLPVTQAAEFTSSGGSMSGPRFVGPSPVACWSCPGVSSAGGAAAQDKSSKLNYSGWLEGHSDGISCIETIIKFSPGGSKNAMTCAAASGTGLQGPLGMAAADGIGWSVYAEVTIVPSGPFPIATGFISTAGNTSVIASGTTVGGQFTIGGDIAALPSNKKFMTRFVAAIGDSNAPGGGAIYANAGAGWVRALEGANACGAGIIRKGKKGKNEG